METKKLLELYFQVLETFGAENQKCMLVEECGELLNALAKRKRGRSTIAEVLTELADVRIMVEQMGYLYGWYAFEREYERKLARLADRVAKHK